MTVSKLTIEIDGFDNATLADNPNEETASLLRQLADQIEVDGIAELDGMHLVDSYGKHCGFVSVDTEDTEIDD